MKTIVVIPFLFAQSEISMRHLIVVLTVTWEVMVLDDNNDDCDHDLLNVKTSKLIMTMSWLLW